jgi:hypothetical protein
MASRPCRAFAQGNCRFGDRCRFQHGPVPAAPDASSSVARGGQGRPTATRASSSGSGSAHPPASANTTAPPVPRDVCRNFWTTNKCSFKTGCRYKHVFYQAPNVVVSAPTNTVLKPLFEESTPSGSGSADTSGPLDGAVGSGADAYVSQSAGDAMSAGDALTALRRYLRDDYRFDKTAFVYAMMKILSSATTGNKQWVRALFILRGSSLILGIER